VFAYDSQSMASRDGLTTSGCKIPCSLIDSAKSFKLSLSISSLSSVVKRGDFDAFTAIVTARERRGDVACLRVVLHRF